ncbi:bifunctional diguanylate cyclase/phosphodiesterase [Undibacterium flavidum]|nr:EAL domain-containing protein [Undibacterium flavidum]
MILAFSIAFTIYVQAEKKVDIANEQRFAAHALGNEMRQSSDDLTRMARAYATSGMPIYRQYYDEILAIRDGRAERPLNYHEIYWDLVLSDNQRPRPSSGEKISFQDLIRQAKISEAEYQKLTLALANSNRLSLLERQAMDLVEALRDGSTSSTIKPLALLTSEDYRVTKASIMWPIAEYHQMMEARTLEAVKHAQQVAYQLRLLVMVICVLMVILLWRAYQSFQLTLGAPVAELRAHLDKLGRADFSEPIQIPKQAEKSVLGLISIAHTALANTEQQRQQTELRNQRLTQFYNVLSQCNQAIVRSHSEYELLQQICNDMVQYAGIRMAWVGLLDTEQKTILPLAAYGTGVEILEHKSFEMAAPVAPTVQPDFGQSLYLQTFSDTVQQARASWVQDWATELADPEWRALGQQYGWAASAAIPLFKNGAVYGVINLYAGSSYAFDEEIQTLLVEMAMDLSFALNRYELEMSRKRSRQMEALRSFMLEQINAEKSLENLFYEVVKHLETMMPGSLCSIVLLDPDGVHLRIGAMPDFPEFFVKAIEGQAIGDGIGSCGHAMFTGQRTIVEEIQSHPYWCDFKELALSAKLAACWSEPIRSANKQVLGAFAIYHAVPTKPETWHISLLEMAAHFLALAIAKDRTESKLRKLSQAVEQSPNIIIITDTEARIEYVNQAFVEKTGMNLEQVTGQTPSILQSGKTPSFVYEEMWEHLRKGESWQGELTNLYKDGKETIELAHISPVRDGNGVVTHFLSLQEDITDKKRTEERIQYLAHYDVLTGLPNRVLLEERAQFALSSAKRKAASVSLIFFDLDHFKNINDSLGHSTGDALLIELSRRLRDVLREDDIISRLGGDEFILLLSGVDEIGAERVAEKLLQTVNQSYLVGQYDLNVSASIGIAVYPEDGEDLETLLRNADTAMYRAKQDGRNNFRFFTQEMQARSGRHLELVNALRYALERQQLQVVYQPQIDLESGRVIGTEALLRWHHPELGTISPAEFIPVAEETGLILTIGEWVLRTAVMQTQQWHALGWNHLSIAVNLSAIQFRHTDLPGTVSQILEAAQLAAHFLELELTEGVAMTDPAGAIAIMNDLHRRGVRMAIDDFGTGYSSLSYLKKFKVSKLKIDQSFIRDISSDPEDKAIIRAIISMAKTLGLQTIAEGVETEEQLNFLSEQACDEVQGYFFARPMAATQFEEFMRQR